MITLVWWSIANDYQAQRVLCMEQKNSFAHEGAFIGEVPYLEHLFDSSDIQSKDSCQNLLSLYPLPHHGPFLPGAHKAEVWINNVSSIHKH